MSALRLLTYFHLVPEFSRVATYPVTESEIQEYHRNLERLGQVLAIIDKYIHVALAALKKEEVFEVVIEMVSRLDLIHVSITINAIGYI
jgi:hypothetical protein